MNTKTFIILAASIILAVFSSYSQNSQGWQYIGKAPSNTIWRPNDIIETPEKHVIVAFWDYKESSHLIKLSEEGILLSETIISTPDTTVILSRLFADSDNPSNEYTAIGLCFPSSGEAEAILTLRFDGDLNVVGRKTVPCVNLSHPLINVSLLHRNNGYTLALSESNQSHHLAKIGSEGDLLEWKKLETDSLVTICNLFEALEEDSHFCMFAHISNNSDAYHGVLVFNDSLQLVKRAHFNQWQTEEPDGSLCISHLCDYYNSMMLPSPNRNGYIISSRLKEALFSNDTIKVDMSSIIASTDSSFVMQEHYEILEHLNDTIEYPAFYKSLDYLTSSITNPYLFQCSMQGNCMGEPGWPFCHSPLSVIVTKADTNLNIIWKRKFYTDMVSSPFAITASADGGCIVAGMVYDFNLERRCDLFVIKIGENGTVGVDEVKEESLAFVYPNPAKETFRIGGVGAKETGVYDILGKCVMTFNGNEADVRTLVAGPYLLKITDTDGKTQIQRIVISK